MEQSPTSLTKLDQLKQNVAAFSLAIDEAKNGPLDLRTTPAVLEDLIFRWRLAKHELEDFEKGKH